MTPIYGSRGISEHQLLMEKREGKAVRSTQWLNWVITARSRLRGSCHSRSCSDSLCPPRAFQVWTNYAWMVVRGMAFLTPPLAIGGGPAEATTDIAGVFHQQQSSSIKGAIIQHVGWIPVEHCCCIHLLQLPKPNSLGRSACLVKVRCVHGDFYCNLSLLNYRGKNIKLGWQGKCLTMGSAEARHGVKFAQHCLERRCQCCSYQLYFKGTQRVRRAFILCISIWSTCTTRPWDHA